MKETLKVFRMIFIAHHQPTEVEQLGEEPLNFPTAHIAPQAATVLGGNPPIGFVGYDHFRAELLHHRFIEPIAVISLVSYQALGHFGHESFFQGFFDQLHFSRRSAFCPQGERKTVAVCNAHDLGALAGLVFPTKRPLF
jgi:hypothetical protein